MRSVQVSEDQKYWEGVLVSAGLAPITGRKMPGEREVGDPILNCPVGRRACSFVGGSCEGSDSCPMPATIRPFQT